MDLSEFDAMLAESKPPERRKFETVQPGTYRVEILSETTKMNKAGTGEYLELVLRVEDGDFKGQRIWDRLALKTNEFARVKLGRIKQVCSIEKLKSSDELVGHKLRVKTKIRVWDGGESADVVEYLPYHAEAQVVNPQPGKELINDDFPF